jgi:membrane associated rhomboid family serine protease
LDQEREPLFNAPWPALTVAVAILASYALQGRVLPLSVYEGFAFQPADPATGRWWTMLTVNLVHAGWGHAAMNAAGALAFGAGVARWFGVGLRGGLVFFAFYLVCGVFSTLGYGLLHRHDPTLLIGASGAVSGLFGGAARLIAGRGRPGPILSQAVLGVSLAWVVANLLLGLLGLWPGVGGAAVAWEAHLIGYGAGLLSFAPFARLAGRQ